MSYGRYFQELRPGDRFRHWPGRTINEYDDTLLDIRHVAPVFHGDTLYADSVVVEAEQLPGRRGAVTVETRASNQREETVLSLRRKIIVPAAPAGETECKR